MIFEQWSIIIDTIETFELLAEISRCRLKQFYLK